MEPSVSTLEKTTEGIPVWNQSDWLVCFLAVSPWEILEKTQRIKFSMGEP